MTFYSDDKQDEFVANLLKFKRDGFYLDIGAGASVGSNNSYFFEKELNWKGICIEKNPIFNSSYENRTCIYINEDALRVDYEKVFEENNFPYSIDFMSLDVDEESTSVLKVLPLWDYRFKVITVEHDGHAYGDLYKRPQRVILKERGYFLVCEEVLNQSGRNIGEEHGFEDWWADEFYFSEHELKKLYSYRLNTEQILQKFNNV